VEVAVSAEDLERYETEIELQLYQEYKAVLPMFRYVVETERRFYLANDVKMEARAEGGRTWFEIELEDAPLRPTNIRFDVASVLAGEIEVFEGAF